MQIKALLVATAAVTMSALAAHADTVDPAQAIAQKFSESPIEKPAPPQRLFTKPGSDYEADMLERARAEALERQQREAQQTTATLAATPVVVAPAPPAPSPSAQLAPPPTKLAALPPKPLAEPPAVRPEAPGPVTAAATVLLVLDPEGGGLGIKPDPIICIDNRCWLSNGITSPAREMPRNQAVALTGTDDMTADSCSGKSGCVYRNVTVDPSARIDVIEVGEGGGASAGAYTVAADRSCRKDGDSLACDNGLATQNFRIWVVPEITAEAAGASSLENAVAEGLPDTDLTSANDK